MATKSLTYGVLPTREEFEAAFAEVTNRCCLCGEDRTHPSQHGDHASGARSGCHSYPNGTPRTPVAAPLGTFYFHNDSRVGTCELTCSELWGELEKACAEWGGALPADPAGASIDWDVAAGQWCSDVLGVLGFEWV